MKKLLGLSVLALIAAVVQAAPQQNVVGSWDLTVESPQGKRDSVLIIKKEGDKLSGVLKGARGERPLDSITLNGSDITFTMNVQAQGQDLTITYKGKVEKDSMKGDADFGGFAQGTWSAVPHKEGAAATPGPAPSGGSTGAANITGVWDFTVETAQGSGSPVFTFKQDGETLTGTYKGQFGEAPLTGTVKGRDVKFAIKVNAQGQEFNVTYTGTVDGNSMKGKAALGELGEATFTAKKRS
jgi:hypothetical protein